VDQTTSPYITYQRNRVGGTLADGCRPEREGGAGSGRRLARSYCSRRMVHESMGEVCLDGDTRSWQVWVRVLVSC